MRKKKHIESETESVEIWTKTPEYNQSVTSVIKKISRLDYIKSEHDNIETIKMSHDAGFFSVCTINLKTIIGYCVNNNKFCNLDTTDQLSWYKDEPINIYDKFFKITNSEFIIEPKLFSSSPDEDQFSNYGLINYDFVTPFIKKYFSIIDEVVEIENILTEKYHINPSETISICYRGNDKIKETNLPSYEEIEKKLNELLYSNPNKKVIIQSDEVEFCEYMKSKNENFIVFDEIEKINKTPYTAIQYTIPIGVKVKNAQTFLAIMSIISKSEYIILNSGNVGMWICLFRGNFDRVHQYLSPKNSNEKKWFSFQS